MKQEQLNKILDDHKLWIESKGEKGKQANLSRSKLNFLNFSGADLQYVIMRNSSLYGANLKDVNLKKANLSGAYLSCAVLYGANLEGANLEKADMTGANLRGAKFTIEIREAKNLKLCEITKEQLPWLSLHPDFSEFYPTLAVS